MSCLFYAFYIVRSQCRFATGRVRGGGVQKKWGGFSRQPAHGKGHPCASSIPPPTPAHSLAPLHACPPHPGVPEPGLDPRVLPGAEPGAGLGAVGALPLLPPQILKHPAPGIWLLRAPWSCVGAGEGTCSSRGLSPGMLCPHIDASPPSVCLHGLKHLFGAGGGGKGSTAFAALTRVSPHACASRVGGAGPVAPLPPFTGPRGVPRMDCARGPGPCHGVSPHPMLGARVSHSAWETLATLFSCQWGRRCHRRAPSPCPGVGGGGTQS